MKKVIHSIRLLLAGCVMFALVAQVQAQPPAGSHYQPGAEGIKGASLPPPGVYLRDYNFFYTAGNVDGLPVDADIFVYVQAPRLIWMTNWKILGANYGMDVIVPFGYTKLEVGGFEDSTFGLGDIQVEPLLLGWHTKQCDFALAYAIWMPTGDSAAPPTADLGKGFWSHMFTAGATWYADEAKTWSISVLNRYEIHTESDDIPVTPGDTATVEFGIAKMLKPGMDVGLVGYWQGQVTDDSAAGFSADPTQHDRVTALGPEITAVWPKLGALFSLRYLREFDAKDRPEGNTITLTVTKRF